MRLSKADIEAIRLALHRAIQYELSLIDSHRVRLVPDGTGFKHVVPEEFKPVVDRCVINIDGWKHLLGRLK